MTAERLPKILRTREAVARNTDHAPEEWRPVAGFRLYEVSSLGRVLSHHGHEPRVLKPFGMGNYLGVSLRAPGGAARRVTLHVLVAETFIGPRPVGQEVRHLDGDDRNNAAVNLAYGTRSENVYDRVLHGTHHYARRTHCSSGHPFSEENTYYPPKGGRSCRTCTREKTNLRRQRTAGISERAT